jgi:hypothetical protein
MPRWHAIGFAGASPDEVDRYIELEFHPLSSLATHRKYLVELSTCIILPQS